MDRRSWLWRRKSLEKSPSGETESSGSVSSHSERFSDDQTVSNVNTQSPEVTSKAAPADEQELNQSLKTLSEKLSEALLNVRAKEELVNQHAKVAEEAVSGWERAENEVSALQKQKDALTQKNLILEEHVSHHDEALKECLRQLRQAKEEHEEKMHHAIIIKNEWETKKSELENQLIELQNQLQIAKTEAGNPMLAAVLSRLEDSEKENSILKLKFRSIASELELMTHERDFSILAAETASKQHLESIKKVARLEAEGRKLKAAARKAAGADDHRSIAASSVYVESFTDSQSDSGERVLVVENDMCKIGGLVLFDNEPCHSQLGQCGKPESVERGLVASSVGIDLMHDFLEMERLAALSETDNPANSGDQNPSRDEMEVLMNRMAELEDNLRKIAAEKVDLENALKECRNHLQASKDQQNQTELELVELKIQLALANEAKQNAEANVMQVQDQLTKANEAKIMVEMELMDANCRKEKAESQLRAAELELDSLKREIEKERNSYRDAVDKCNKLEGELSRTKVDYHSQRSAIIDEFRNNQDKELAVAANKFAECQQTIASLGRQLKSLAALEDLLIEPEPSPEAVPKMG